jgi:tRNA(fMet)-specific endonuclease VapC
MILLDTDHISVLLDPRHALRDSLMSRLAQAGDELGIPIICVEEQLRGWLAQVRRVHDPHKQIAPYLRLAKLLDFLHDWRIVDWSQQSADMLVALRGSRLRIGAQDLQIAATAIANDALLLSANLRHFEQVPGLRVQDWLYV